MKKMTKHRAAIKKARKAAELAAKSIYGTISDWNLGRSTESVYKEYIKQYNKAAKTIAKMDEDKSTKYQFKSRIQQIIDDSSLTSMKDVVAELVDTQMYAYTKSEADRLLKFLKNNTEVQKNYDISSFDIASIRAGAADSLIETMNESIKEDYYALVHEMGYNSVEARHFISQYYFGSK